jgi:probable DNA repair protein
LHNWLHAADEVVLSHSRQSPDGECRPSRLIVAVSAISAGELGVQHATARERYFDARARESLIDDAAPAFAGAQTAHGGTSVLKDQSLCPFRAFAHHRLFAAALAEPVPGFNAMERGTIAHRVLAAVWGELRDADGLRARGAGPLRELIAAKSRLAIAESLRGRPHPGRVFVQVEEARVADLVRRWLELEATRPVAFRVVEREARHSMNIGGMTINGSMDRVDELDDGSRLIIDYKTGKASAGKWEGERPDEPQLPAYVCFGSDGPVSGAAFGILDRFAPRFAGITRASGMLPDVKPLGGKDHPAPGQLWDETVQTWRTTLERIARDFLAGDARVAPKNTQACATCDLHVLCRIHERMAEDDSSGEGDEDANADN